MGRNLLVISLAVLALSFGGLSATPTGVGGDGTAVVNFVGEDEGNSYREGLVEPRPLLGRNPCTFGPTFWCQNITQASMCSATKHCINKVWEVEALPPTDNDDVCQVCKEMVKEARDQLLSNETQEELREVLEGSCALIPVKPVSAECKHLMDNFLPELVDALASRMDPQLVCKVSGLCNSQRIDDMLKDRDLSCENCFHYLSKAQKYLEADSETLEAELVTLCGHLGSYSDSCSASVRTNLDQIRNYLQEADVKELCELIGLCKEGVTTTALSLYSPKEDLGCDFCKQLVSYLKNWMTQNTTREEFDLVVKNFCREVKVYKKECQEWFQQYGDEVYRLIVDELDGETFCERLGICPSPVLDNEQPALTWSILKVGEPDEEGNKMVALLPGERVDESAQCELCSLVASKVQEYMESPSTEKDAEDFVDKLCKKYLPSEMAAQCQEFVTEYGDDLIQMIADEADPKEICPGLGLCPKKEEVMDVLPTCAICEFTITKLLDMVGKNRTKESIERATEKVCKMMPAKYTEECESFMQNYGDRVIEMILVDGTAHEVCAALHLCLFKNGRPTTPTPLVPLKDDPKCVLCEYVITTLDQKIKDNATEEEIKVEVEHVCTYLPRTIQGKCRDFVDVYGDEIIAFLAQEMDPEQICTELKLCKATIPQAGVGVYISSADSTGRRCPLCHFISEVLKENSNKLETIEVCDWLKDQDKDECTSLLEDYGPYMTRLISEGRDDICEDMDVC